MQFVRERCPTLEGAIVAELTEQVLRQRVHQRAVSAARKKLVDKAGAAGRHFFNNHQARFVRDVMAKTVRYEQTSCTTSWEWMVVAPIAVESDAKIIVQYDAGGWGTDIVTITLINADGTRRCVFRAQTNHDKKIGPEVVGDWFYRVYVPGTWERLLDGPKLEAIAEKRKEAAIRSERRESALLTKDFLKRSVSDSVANEAFTNYGIR